MKELTSKQFAMYFGCEVQYEYENYSEFPELKKELRYGILTGLSNSEVDIATNWGVIRRTRTQVKLVLRSLRDLTEEQIEKLYLKGWCHLEDESGVFVCEVNGGYEPYEMSEILTKLRDAGYDCDQLITQGLALNKGLLPPIFPQDRITNKSEG